MRNRYALKNIRTGAIEYTDLSSLEVSRIIGIPSGRICKYARYGYICKEQWKVMLTGTDIEDLWTEEIRTEWDCIRKMVLGGLQRGKGSYEEKLARWRRSRRES